MHGIGNNKKLKKNIFRLLFALLLLGSSIVGVVNLFPQLFVHNTERRLFVLFWNPNTKHFTQGFIGVGVFDSQNQIVESINTNETAGFGYSHQTYKVYSTYDFVGVDPSQHYYDFGRIMIQDYPDSDNFFVVRLILTPQMIADNPYINGPITSINRP